MSHFELLEYGHLYDLILASEWEEESQNDEKEGEDHGMEASSVSTWTAGFSTTHPWMVKWPRPSGYDTLFAKYEGFLGDLLRRSEVFFRTCLLHRPFSQWEVPLGLRCQLDKLIYCKMLFSRHQIDPREIAHFQEGILLKMNSGSREVLGVSSPLEESLKFHRDLRYLEDRHQHSYEALERLLKAFVIGNRETSACRRKRTLMVQMPVNVVRPAWVSALLSFLGKTYTLVILDLPGSWPVRFSHDEFTLQFMYQEDPVLFFLAVQQERWDVIREFAFVNDYPLVFTALLLRQPELVQRYLCFEDLCAPVISWRTQHLWTSFPDQHFFLLLDLNGDLGHLKEARGYRSEEILALLSVAGSMTQRKVRGLLDLLCEVDPVYKMLFETPRRRLAQFREERQYARELNAILTLLHRILLHFRGSELEDLCEIFREFFQVACVADALKTLLNGNHLREVMFLMQISGDQSMLPHLFACLVNSAEYDLLYQLLQRFPEVVRDFWRLFQTERSRIFCWRAVIENHFDKEEFFRQVYVNVNYMNEYLFLFLRGLDSVSFSILSNYDPQLSVREIWSWDATLLHFLVLLKKSWLKEAIHPKWLLSKNRSGISPFLLMVATGDVDLLHYVLPYLEPSDVVYDFGTALKVAILNGQALSMKFLLKYLSHLPLYESDPDSESMVKSAWMLTLIADEEIPQDFLEPHGHHVFDWLGQVDRTDLAQLALDYISTENLYPRRLIDLNESYSKFYLIAHRRCTFEVARQFSTVTPRQWLVAQDQLRTILHWGDFAVGVSLLVSDEYFCFPKANGDLRRYLELLQKLPLFETKFPIFLRVSLLSSSFSFYFAPPTWPSFTQKRRKGRPKKGRG